VTEEDLTHFSSFLAPSSILSTLSPSNTPADELTAFNDDWMGKYKGKSTTVLKPRTTEEVSRIIKYCNERRIGIVPQGGNTGLVGGSVPVKDEVILNLSNLNKIRSFDPVSGKALPHHPPSVPSWLTQRLGILVADAGCILQSLIDYLAPHNHIMPIDLGAKGRFALSSAGARRGRLNCPCLVAT
jgi:FAD/FMN-containing dehydrogenase